LTNSLIVANILHRPMRTFISILAVAIQVTLVLLVTGITGWMRADNAKRQEGIGADIMFRGSNAQVFFMSSAPMTIKIRKVLEKVEGIKVVAPVLIQTTMDGGLSNIFGIDLKSYSDLSGGFNYIKGGPFEQPYDVLVDDLHAKNRKLKVGDTVRLLAHDFHVCGIVEHGKGARVFIPLTTLQNLMEVPDMVSLFYLKVWNPSGTEAVIQEIKNIRGLSDYSIISIKEYLSQITNAYIPALNTFINVMVFIACLIGFLVIYLSMYTTITERTREIGILKSLGASKFFIVNAILREALLLSLLGILLGLGFSFVAKRIITSALPTLSVLITMPWILKASMLALLAGVLGGFYPSLRAASQDPITALSYE
jgi:putative ABC transport system permease protein